MISKEDCIRYAVTGPMLRSAGVPLDLRKDEPYLVYDQVDFDVPVGEVGDNYDRYLVCVEEMHQSLRIVEQCLAKLEKLGPGPVNVDDPRVRWPAKGRVFNRMEELIQQFKSVTEGPRVPAGEAYSAIESANGELGFYLVSDGTAVPCEGALPAAELHQPRADAADAAGRDARRPDPDLRLHQHDRRGVRPLMSRDRARVWKQLGAPTDQVGSVNDPRTREECGVRWNEKWVYRGPERGRRRPRRALEPLRPARRVQRAPDGSVRAGALAGRAREPAARPRRPGLSGRAGPPPLRPFGLVLHHDGRWTHEGQPIRHARLRAPSTAPCATSRRSGSTSCSSGASAARSRWRRRRFFVRDVDLARRRARSLGRSRERLDPASLRVSPLDGALLCRVKRDARARRACSRASPTRPRRSCSGGGRDRRGSGDSAGRAVATDAAASPRGVVSAGIPPGHPPDPAPATRSRPAARPHHG